MRRTLGLLLAAGVLACSPMSSAHAQAAYGYDSYYYNLPQSANYWYSSGYQGIYTDPSTTTFVPGTTAPYRGVSPYVPPPYTQFGRSDGLAAAASGMVTNTPARVQTMSSPVARPTVLPGAPVPQRRGLLGRLRGRR